MNSATHCAADKSRGSAFGPTLLSRSQLRADARGRRREDLRDAMTASGEHLMHHGLIAMAVGGVDFDNGSIGDVDGSHDGVDDAAIVKKVLAELMPARMRV